MFLNELLAWLFVKEHQLSSQEVQLQSLYCQNKTLATKYQKLKHFLLGILVSTEQLVAEIKKAVAKVQGLDF